MPISRPGWEGATAGLPSVGGEQRAVLAQLPVATASTVVTEDTPSPGRAGGCQVRRHSSKGAETKGHTGWVPNLSKVPAPPYPRFLPLPVQ